MISFHKVRVGGSNGSREMLLSVIPRVGEYVVIKSETKEVTRMVKKVTHIPYMKHMDMDSIFIEIEVRKEEEEVG